MPQQPSGRPPTRWASQPPKSCHRNLHVRCAWCANRSPSNPKRHQVNSFLHSAKTGEIKANSIKQEGRRIEDLEGIRTVLDRQGLPQVAQTRLRTASVDSEKLECLVSSACSCASSTLLRRAPQSPQRRESPAIEGRMDRDGDRSKRSEEERRDLRSVMEQAYYLVARYIVRVGLFYSIYVAVIINITVNVHMTKCDPLY